MAYHLLNLQLGHMLDDLVHLQKVGEKRLEFDDSSCQATKKGGL
jgi:hypothetical protein